MAKRFYSIDKDAIREIELFANNTQEFFFKGVIPLLENYAKKKAKGTFDKKKALKGYENLIPYATRLYQKEFGDLMRFNPEERNIISKDFYEYYENARRSLRRIEEESVNLTPRMRQRMIYARSELAIVASTYYYYIGLEKAKKLKK